MPPTRLLVARSERARLGRLGLAAGAVISWVVLVAADLFLSVMFFSDPDPWVAILTSPLLLLAPYLASMAGARGAVEVHADSLVIRHPRVLRRPLVVPRTQVARVIIDDGEATGRARFATGDPQEPLLWTSGEPTRQRADRPLIGDSLLPNLAIVLERPLSMEAARDAFTAVPFTREIDPPPRHGLAEVLMLTLEDADGARRALAGWPVQEPVAPHVVPQQVAAAAARVPQDATTVLIVAAVIAAVTIEHQAIGFLIWLPIALLMVQRMARRRGEQAAAARADLARRAPSLTAAERVTAAAAIEANLGGPTSQGPPGWN